MTGAEQARALEDYHYLCFNCGTISPWDRFSAWQRDDEDEWRPSEPGESDPMLRCPCCGWEHVDDDSNPGIFDGSRTEVEAERGRVMPDYADTWLDALADALSAAEAELRQARENLNAIANDLAAVTLQATAAEAALREAREVVAFHAPPDKRDEEVSRPLARLRAVLARAGDERIEP